MDERGGTMSAMSTQFAELSEIKELSETIDKLTDYLMGDGVDVEWSINAWCSYAILCTVQELLAEGATLPSKTVEKYLSDARGIMVGVLWMQPEQTNGDE